MVLTQNLNRQRQLTAKADDKCNRSQPRDSEGIRHGVNQPGPEKNDAGHNRGRGSDSRYVSDQHQRREYRQGEEIGLVIEPGSLLTLRD